MSTWDWLNELFWVSDSLNLFQICMCKLLLTKLFPSKFYWNLKKNRTRFSIFVLCSIVMWSRAWFVRFNKYAQQCFQNVFKNLKTRLFCFFYPKFKHLLISTIFSFWDFKFFTVVSENWFEFLADTIFQENTEWGWSTWAHYKL